MKKFLSKIALFSFIALVLSYPIYWGLDFYVNQYYAKTSRVRWTFSKQNQQYDYVFLGTSRMANSVSVSQFDSTLKTNSINIATSASSYGENYAVLYQFLENGNSTQNLILTFDLFKSIHHDKDQEVLNPLIFKNIDFYPYMNSPAIKEVYLDHNPSWKVTLWEYLPIARYVEFNNYFKVDQVAKFISKTETPSYGFNPTNGEQLNKRPGFDGKKSANPNSVRLGPRGEKYLFKILELAKEKNINIILITAPYYDVNPLDKSFYGPFLDRLKKDYRVRYYDYSSMKEWKEARYFTDVIHINDLASPIFTKALCDSLR